MLENNAFPGLVNADNETPLDVGKKYEEVVALLQESMDKHMIDMEAVRRMERIKMLEDANKLKKNSTLMPILSSAGSTSLHVAAAKNYIEVIRFVL